MLRLIGSLGVYQLPLNLFRNPQACLEDCIALHWSTFGGPLSFLWGSSAHLGARFGPLHRDVFRVPWGCVGDGLMLFGASFKKCSAGSHREPMALKYCACAQNLTQWNLHGPCDPEVPAVTGNRSTTKIQTPIPHALGIRMTRVSQTPSSSCSFLSMSLRGRP